MADLFKHGRIQLHDFPKDAPKENFVFEQTITSTTPRRYTGVGRSSFGPVVLCEIQPAAREQTCVWFLVKPNTVVDRNVVGYCAGVLDDGTAIYSPCVSGL